MSARHPLFRLNNPLEIGGLSRYNLPSKICNPMRAILIANGELSDLNIVRAALRSDDLLIAADGGLHYFRALGLWPAVVVGDLDSISSAERAALAEAGVRVEQFPARKDQTDLELAVRFARDAGARDILIFGALGGRWDQSLANLLLLAHPDLGDLRLRLIDGSQTLYLARGETLIEGRTGDTVSLIPLTGDAHGVTTAGLDYPLADGRLPFGATLGVSNVLVGERATVTVREGAVMCIVIRNP
jgi:thiamine pyrophosphokinase